MEDNSCFYKPVQKRTGKKDLLTYLLFSSNCAGLWEIQAIGLFWFQALWFGSSGSATYTGLHSSKTEAGAF